MKLSYLKDMFYSLFKIVILKIKYKNKIFIKSRQRLGKNFKLSLTNMAKVEIGEKLYTRTNVNLLCDGGHLVIGNNVFMNHNVSITCLGEIYVGNRVTIANNVVIVDHNHDYKGNSGRFLIKDVVIGDNTWIGANSVILPGVSLGKNCVIAAGSVVTKSFPDNSVIMGSPAKVYNP